MGNIAKGVKNINFTMLYGNYCYIFIENILKNSLRVLSYRLLQLRNDEITNYGPSKLLITKINKQLIPKLLSY